MVADPLPAVAAVHAGEDVEAGFEPLVPTLRHLQGFVEGMLGGDAAVDDGLRSAEGEVAVQFHHQLLRRDRLRTVYLNFVVVLRPQCGSSEENKEESPEHSFHANLAAAPMRKALALTTAVTAAAWAVRGRSSQVFGRGIWHGSRETPSIALTFDDGPSEHTGALLDILAHHGVPATFFQCGANVDALPAMAREVVEQGHEVGNHSYGHPLLAMRNSVFVRDEFLRADHAIEQASGVLPRFYRAPHGVKWFGLGDLPMTGVMWDVIGLDWKRDAAHVARRVLSQTRNGSIICLHDGRVLDRAASIANTLQAVRWIIPRLLDRGFEFQTVSQLCPPR